jgi:hypothetical protein
MWSGLAHLLCQVAIRENSSVMTDCVCSFASMAMVCCGKLKDPTPAHLNCNPVSSHVILDVAEARLDSICG